MKKINYMVPALWAVAIAALGYGGVYAKDSLFKKDATSMPGVKTVAVVDGYSITEAELAPMLQQGADRPTALDRRITQSVIARVAEKSYKTEAEVLLAANRNDILTQLFLTKRTEEIKKSVTEKEIADFYQKNVRDEDYKKASLKVFLTSDAREAQAFFEGASKASGTKELDNFSSKMTYLQKEGDHFLALQSAPYNLGQIIKTMKAGDVLRPVVIREGVLVVYVEALKDSPKPTLESLKAEIRTLLVSEKLNTEIQDLRKVSKIELKG